MDELCKFVAVSEDDIMDVLVLNINGKVESKQSGVTLDNLTLQGIAGKGFSPQYKWKGRKYTNSSKKREWLGVLVLNINGKVESGRSMDGTSL